MGDNFKPKEYIQLRGRAESKMSKEKFFDSTIELFRKYQDKMQREKPEGYNGALASEVLSRLEQLSFFCELIHSYELRAKTNALESLAKTNTSSCVMKKRISILFEMSTFVECFYYFAHRILKILTKTKHPLPCLHNFKAVGVRDVRNKLLEHCEDQDSQILRRSFIVGDEIEPTLKFARPIDHSSRFYDKGFWTNANEFKANLEKVLRKVLKD